MTTAQYIKITNEIKEKISSVIIGKDEQIEKMLACLFANGHLLLEDMPGVGKTTLASSLAKVLNVKFSRIQFTADLLPSDIIGTKIYHRQSEKFEFIKGPIFSNFVLADELNRAPPKTQSALLQSMSGNTISIDKEDLTLANPFMVIATQNPRGFHGTYPLPESQRDRFMLRLSLGYPSKKAEIDILKNHMSKPPIEALTPSASAEDVINIRAEVKKVSIGEPILEYISRVVSAIRSHPDVIIPISPRGSIALMQICQSAAYLRGNKWVDLDIVKEFIPFVFCHRISMKRNHLSEEGARELWIKTEILQKVKID